jgi:hypothetical protein
MIALVYGDGALLIDLVALIVTGNNIDYQRAKCKRALVNLICKLIQTEKA